MNKLNIETASPEKHLTHHLETSERIILSGPFGIGKSYFLKNYFESRIENFIVITLRPINYMVSSNEDIFQLIKYDIIYELLIHSKEYELFDNTVLPEAMMKEYFIANQLGDILENFLTAINLIDKSALDLAKYLYSLINEYEKFKRKHLDALNDFKTLELFSNTFTNKIGSIYENDFISELINNSIEKLKANGKKTILVVDDLDRIDPEHIFRLINVFGAHLDVRVDENKFSFDTTILVCDIKNIKGIFKHKYGKDVDFEGYIDKFYSNEVFYYDNTSAIINWLEQIEKTISIRNRPKTQTYSFLFFILSNMSKNNLLNLRSLTKLKLEITEEGNLVANTNSDYNLENLLYLDVFFVLKSIFQDTSSLISKLEILAKLDDISYNSMNKLSRAFSTISNNNRQSTRLLERFILPVLAKSQAYKGPNETNIYEGHGIKIEYQVEDYDNFLANIKKYNDNEQGTFNGRIPLWSLIAEATSKLAAMTGLEHY